MIIDGINFKELNITKDGELIASITDGKDGIVHKEGYRVQLVVEDVGMSFAEAFKRMKAGAKVKILTKDREIYLILERHRGLNIHFLTFCLMNG